MEHRNHGDTLFQEATHPFVSNMNHFEIMPAEVQLPDSNLLDTFCMLREREM